MPPDPAMRALGSPVLQFSVSRATFESGIMHRCTRREFEAGTGFSSTHYLVIGVRHSNHEGKRRDMIDAQFNSANRMLVPTSGERSSPHLDSDKSCHEIERSVVDQG